MVIPHAAFKPRRWQATTAFGLFLLALWSGVTIWAGYIVGRHADYWITKADNRVMVAKMSYLAVEMERARESLDIAKATDRQLRVLLGLSHREDLVSGDAAVGGPTGADRISLRRLLAIDPGSVRQSDWHQQLEALRQESLKRLASFQEIAWYIGNQRTMINATPSMWPTAGRITSLFGYRLSPMQNAEDESGEFHPGVDIANQPDTLIFATANGTVRFSGWSSGYGQLVVIDHGYGIATAYGHTSKTLVKAGDRVSRGQVIAYMGSTGRATGAHLHYEIRRNGQAVDPMMHLKVRSNEDLLGRAQALASARGR